MQSDSPRFVMESEGTPNIVQPSRESSSLSPLSTEHPQEELEKDRVVLESTQEDDTSPRSFTYENDAKLGVETTEIESPPPLFAIKDVAVVTPTITPMPKRSTNPTIITPTAPTTTTTTKLLPSPPSSPSPHSYSPHTPPSQLASVHLSNRPPPLRTIVIPPPAAPYAQLCYHKTEDRMVTLMMISPLFTTNSTMTSTAITTATHSNNLASNSNATSNLMETAVTSPPFSPPPSPPVSPPPMMIVDDMDIHSLIFGTAPKENEKDGAFGGETTGEEDWNRIPFVERQELGAEMDANSVTGDLHMGMGHNSNSSHHHFHSHEYPVLDADANASTLEVIMSSRSSSLSSSLPTSSSSSSSLSVTNEPFPSFYGRDHSSSVVVKEDGFPIQSTMDRSLSLFDENESHTDMLYFYNSDESSMQQDQKKEQEPDALTHRHHHGSHIRARAHTSSWNTHIHRHLRFMDESLKVVVDNTQTSATGTTQPSASSLDRDHRHRSKRWQSNKKVGSSGCSLSEGGNSPLDEVVWISSETWWLNGNSVDDEEEDEYGYGLNNSDHLSLLHNVAYRRQFGWNEEKDNDDIVEDHMCGKLLFRSVAKCKNKLSISKFTTSSSSSIPSMPNALSGQTKASSSSFMPGKLYDYSVLH